MTPKDSISELIRNAQRIQMQLANMPNRITPQERVMGRLFVKAVMPYGMEGIARDLGYAAAVKARNEQSAANLQMVQQFILGCQNEIGKISIVSKNLSSAGNSSSLMRKFNPVMQLRDPLKVINRAIQILYRIQTYDLTWNINIPAELNRRKEQKMIELEEKRKLKVAKRRVEMSQGAQEALDRNEIGVRLEKYPTVRISVLGAFDALENEGPDAERHCISSCRTALETICIEIGGIGDWKEAAYAIFHSDSDRNLIKAIHHYLSAKGSHGGHEPTRHEAEAGLKQTMVVIGMILDETGTEGNKCL
jgi:hypothetical protein